jgi:phage tail sheath protein FI
MGILNTPSGTTAIESGLTAFNGATANDYHLTIVYGEKVHLGANGADETLITTILAPDVAGCMARTDRDYFPWFSPAGTKRGKILNVTRLARTLRAAEQDYLYDAGINPVVTFPGEGTFLFGDKTTYPITSTLSRVNVARLFINLKKTLGAVARRTLFEVNNAATRSTFKSTAEKILSDIKNQNGLTEYKVICDESNNPASIVEANEFYAEVLIKPLTSINFITITLTNVDLETKMS